MFIMPSLNNFNTRSQMVLDKTFIEYIKGKKACHLLVHLVQGTRIRQDQT